MPDTAALWQTPDSPSFSFFKWHVNCWCAALRVDKLRFFLCTGATKMRYVLCELHVAVNHRPVLFLSSILIKHCWYRNPETHSVKGEASESFKNLLAIIWTNVQGLLTLVCLIKHLYILCSVIFECLFRCLCVHSFKVAFSNICKNGRSVGNMKHQVVVSACLEKFDCDFLSPTFSSTGDIKEGTWLPSELDMVVLTLLCQNSTGSVTAALSQLLTKSISTH